MNDRRISTHGELSDASHVITENDVWARRARIIQILVFTAAAAAFLQIVSGFFSAGTAGRMACPDWPLCFGQFAFPDEPAAAVQYSHRLLGLLTGILLAGSYLLARRWFRPARPVRKLLVFSGGLLILQSLVGAIEVLSPTEVSLAPLHLGLALVVLAGLLAAGWIVAGEGWQEGSVRELRWETPSARLALVNLAAIFVLMVSAVWLAGSQPSLACPGWPLCGGGLPVDAAGWLQFGHRLLAVLTGVLVLAAAAAAWRRHYENLAVLTSASGVLFLLAGQGLIGALQVSRAYPADLVLLHAVNSAALFAVQFVLVLAAGMKGTGMEDRPAVALPLARAGVLERMRDFVLLSKPIIVLLLLFTTFAGMVAGAGRLPGWPLIFWTMLGGGLSAAGASAINQYIDRELDRFMVRTAKRPLPRGKLAPAEGLAFGVMACLSGFYLLAGFVNLLTALLSLAGMVYYVVVYSVWLKPRTVQNVVIGGGAGSMPVLVGWAAASGGLEWRALGLAMIVFLWSPPHFWALALVRWKDYARVGIPMLPVVFGETFTRRQIFYYNLVLVGFTLALPLMQVGGVEYWVVALLAGAVLMFYSVRVWIGKGNKHSWMLYRYSSMYLAIIFFGLILDTLLNHLS